MKRVSHEGATARTLRTPSRLGAWLGNAFGVLLASVVLFAAIETIFRAWLPEFVVGQNDEETSRGKKRTFGLWGPVDVRLPSANAVPGSGRRRIVFVGDSITDGHGLAFEDTYYGRLANMLAAIPSAADTAIIANGVQGSNYVDNLERVERLPLDGVAAVYYQFNYNDLVPVRKTELVGMDGWVLTEFNRFRARYLDRSAFLRAAQHVGGWLRRRTSGSCEERGLDALEGYSFTYGSRPFRNEAEQIWNDFEARVRRAKAYLDSKRVDFRILVVPTLYHVDKHGLHPHFNYLNLDFSCATIDPDDRLRRIAAEAGIPLVDATPLVRAGFERRLAEGNFEPFFFPADHNHINGTASFYVAGALLADILGQANLASGPREPALGLLVLQ